MKNKENIKYEAHITGLSHEGAGLSIVNQKKTFISGALPGETVTCHITQKRSRYQHADLIEVIEAAAPDRVTPPCKHSNICGGCNLQHMNMEMQLQLKQNTLLEQLKHFGKVIPKVILSPLNDETIGYRRKARLGVKFVIKKNKMLVGFREKAKRYLADLSSCAVLHPKVGEKLELLAELIASLEQFSVIAQIEVAIGDTDAALIFRNMQTLSKADEEKLIAFGKIYQFAIYLQPNSPETFRLLYSPNDSEWLCYTLPEFNLRYLFHPLDFTQVNLGMNRKLVSLGLQLLEVAKEDSVLDLFCGIGNFTLALAKHAQHVTGIEGSALMVERAYANAQINGIHNVNFYAVDLQSALTACPWIKSYDKVLLDPPRAGAKEILPLFKQFSPTKIVYISCNPATLARDAGELVHQYGYSLEKVGVVNMFPHTAHIEAIAVFEKLKE